MGRDKALVVVGGRALAVVAADALRGAGAVDVTAVGGDADALAALGLDVMEDRWPGHGPLGGLVTALDAAGEDVVVVLACDLPYITAAAVTAVVGGLGDADAAVPTVGGRPQPLLAAWRRSAALSALHDAFDAGERAIWRAMVTLRVRPVTLADERWTRDADHAGALFPPDPPG
jgi:molybdopterin-guanine dinucleotide biosynthesis protein A